MRVSDQLLERFFSGDCTDEEKKLVTDYLASNPDSLARHLTERSWADFDPGALPEAVPTRQLRQSIEKRVGRAPARRISRGWMAAATVIFLVCLVSFFHWSTDKEMKKNTPGVAAGRTVASVRTIRTDTSKTVLRSITNESTRTEKYALPDGSVVELAGHSVISFYQPFVGGRRDLFLRGVAVFTVKKDRLRPFSVHSGSIVTTALGTVFKVNDNSRLVTKVHLFSGRVVVRKEATDAHKSFKDVYLMPGQELLLNNAAFTVRIKTDEPKITAAEKTQPEGPQVFQFNQESLADIFLSLKRNFHKKIVYTGASIKKIEFTGVFDNRKETLDSFLNTLCILNELKLEKKGKNGFSIKEK